jgi:hypothetical protein
VDQQFRKRPLPWMIVTLIALIGVLGWRMASVGPGADVKEAGPPLQVGAAVVASRETVACKTPELSGQAAVFQVVGAKDKLRGLLERGDCLSITRQPRFTILALQEKLAQVDVTGATPATVLWLPVRDLTRK